MKYFLCKGVAILATLSEQEAILEAFDIDAARLAAFGYSVIAADGDEYSEAAINAAGNVEWRLAAPALQPLTQPLTPLEKFDAEFAASF